MNTKLVYSTDKTVNINENVIKDVDLNPSEQKVYLHLEKKVEVRFYPLLED